MNQSLPEKRKECMTQSETSIGLTRANGLERLDEFLPNTPGYGALRNHDRGPTDRGNVSGLSRWITPRLIRESEVVAATLTQHPLATVEKWIQEICWRTYWKGWLEMRPGVWSNFVSDCKELAGDADTDAYNQAVRGTTGIACFDAWATELCETGYLHNHARMWFASIWIFTLRLPWQLGAAFFYRHLIDADAASNTLSWRWVAGLHTKGKHYVARAENIAKFTNGRFDPRGDLDENPTPIIDPREYERETLTAKTTAIPADRRIGLIIHPEDLSPELVLPAGTGPTAIGTLTLPEISDSARISGMADAARRASDHWKLPVAEIELIGDWIESNHLDGVAWMHLPQGPFRDALQPTFDSLAVEQFELFDPWDCTLWPHATHGYFRFKSALPGICRSITANRD